MKLLILISILFTVAALITCESIVTDDTSDFCGEVNNLNFSEVENKIEKYLDYVRVYHSNSDVYYSNEISKLKNWLLKKSCILEVTVRPGIIETYPPIKELSITFDNSDSTFVKTLDIILDSNLNVIFH